MRLIVNGDDLGYTPGVNLGIVEAYHKGILRSTTALCNCEYIYEAKELVKDCKDLGIGVHLTLTLGKPLSDNRTLHDENGYFYPGRKKVWEMNPDYNEIYVEWKAQIEKYMEIFGHRPTHLDSHHSVHDATPQALEVAKRLASEYGLPLRRYSSFGYIGYLFADNMNKDNLIKTLGENIDRDLEIMTHPAYCDLELYRQSSYSFGRVKELDTLCDKDVISFIEDHYIELVHY